FQVLRGIPGRVESQDSVHWKLERRRIEILSLDQAQQLLCAHEFQQGRGHVVVGLYELVQVSIDPTLLGAWGHRSPGSVRITASHDLT
ncbi:hypothetical protein BZG21_43970, partial [Escherichia coli]|nr:hypothetical protein [Escherichia coli]